MDAYLLFFHVAICMAFSYETILLLYSDIVIIPLMSVQEQLMWVISVQYALFVTYGKMPTREYCGCGAYMCT